MRQARQPYRLTSLLRQRVFPRLHPALAEIYRTRVADLAAALQRGDHTEALILVRGLIERVTLSPLTDGGFEIELSGDIAAMIRLSLGANAKSRPHAGEAGHDLLYRSVKVVAGERNQLDLLLVG